MFICSVYNLCFIAGRASIKCSSVGKSEGLYCEQQKLAFVDYCRTRSPSMQRWSMSWYVAYWEDSTNLVCFFTFSSRNPPSHIAILFHKSMLICPRPIYRYDGDVLGYSICSDGISNPYQPYWAALVHPPSDVKPQTFPVEMSSKFVQYFDFFQLFISDAATYTEYFCAYLWVVMHGFQFHLPILRLGMCYLAHSLTIFMLLLSGSMIAISEVSFS